MSLILLAIIVTTIYGLYILPKGPFSMPVEENLTKRIRPSAFTPSQLDKKLEEALRGRDIRNVVIRTKESFNDIQLPSIIPDYQPFDARFTFATLLHHLRNHHLDELPGFHWADFVSMEPLEEYFFRKKQTCADFDIRSHDKSINQKEGREDPIKYCINDDEIENYIETSTDEELVRNLKYIQKQTYSTGFHMFKNANRQSFENRPILGRSYVHDFMPPPKSLILLFPEFKYFQIDINPEKKLKLVQYADVPHRSINVKDQVSSFMKSLPVKANPMPYKLELLHEEFIDKSPEIVEQLEDSEEPLSNSDQLYMEALKYSMAIKSPTKYFDEARIIKSQKGFSSGIHYDWRFFNGNIISNPEIDMSIHGLLRAFFKLANSYNLKCWIRSGSLLSWYWDGMKFPWDNDVDITMPIDELHKLARQFNQSLIVNFGNDLDQQIGFGRYFLDCSTFIGRREKENGRNNIDARLIDVDTGVYIDLTGLAVSETKAPERYDYLLKSTKFERGVDREAIDKSVTQYDTNNFLQAYNCKNRNFFRLKELSPLLLSLFDGEYTYVPNQITRILMDHFSAKSIIKTSYKDYTYLPLLRLWIKNDILYDFLAATTKKSKQELKKKKVIPEFNEDQCVQLLITKEKVLIEYLKTRRATALHDMEIKTLLQDESTEALHYLEGTLIDNTEIFRPDLFTTRNQRGKSYEKAWKRVNKLIEQYEKKGKKGHKKKPSSPKKPPSAKNPVDPANNANPQRVIKVPERMEGKQPPKPIIVAREPRVAHDKFPQKLREELSDQLDEESQKVPKGNAVRKQEEKIIRDKPKMDDRSQKIVNSQEQLGGSKDKGNGIPILEQRAKLMEKIRLLDIQNPDRQRMGNNRIKPLRYVDNSNPFERAKKLNE